jgi:hypothetical protein
MNDALMIFEYLVLVYYLKNHRKNMMTLTFILLFLLSGQTWGNKINIKSIDTISEAGQKTVDYFLVNSVNGDPVHFLIVTEKSNRTYFEFYTEESEDSPRITVNDQGFSRLRSFSHCGKIYIFMTKLFIIDTDIFQIDSLDLQRDDYINMSLSFVNNDTILIASTFDYIDIYSFPEFIPLSSILRDETIQFDMPLIVDSLIIYRNRVNEIAIFNYKNSVVRALVNTGEEGAYLFGIRVGSFSDNISWYRTSKVQRQMLLYITCFSGTILSVDPTTGSILNQVHRFQGTGNNAGLISSFELYDVSGDGIPDIIGSSVDKNIYCIDGKSLQVIWQTDSGHENQIPMSYYDLNDDYIPEIFFVNDAMTFQIISGKDGQIVCRQRLSSNLYQTGTSLADITGNGHLNLIVKLSKSKIGIYRVDPVHTIKDSVIWLSLF